MVSIEPGMTRDEVVDLIGPPVSTMSGDEFRAAYSGTVVLGTGQRSGLFDRFRRTTAPPRSEPILWLYTELAEGESTMISFRHGVVESVDSSPFEGNRGGPRHEWARELIETHVGRVGVGRMTTRAGWRRLTSVEVMDFVLDAGDNAYPPLPGRIGGHTRQFGELTVLVSMFRVARARQVRRLLPGGYVAHFFWLIDQFGVRLGQSDVAHWVLCHDDVHDTKAVHLSYLPAQTKGMSALLPVDLLSGKERREYLR